MTTCEIGLTVEELIGLPNYSNVRIAPQMVRKTVEDTPEAIEAGFAQIAEDVGRALAVQREVVFNSVKAAAKAGKYADIREAR
jgi:hypothetical protein